MHLTHFVSLRMLQMIQYASINEVIYIYTYIAHHKFLRYEKTFGICIDERLDHCLTQFYRIAPEDFFPLTLFNSYFSDREIIKIIDESGYRTRDGATWFAYLRNRYADILSTSERKGERTEILLINKYLDAIPEFTRPNKLTFPIMASIRLNNYCESNCIYCFNRSNRAHRSQLSYEVIESILAQLFDGGVTTLNITGGDPFCHPDIYNILKLLIIYKFKFNISTKRILNEDDIQAINRCGLKHLQISIDSCDDAINEHLIHRKQYFQKQKSAIQALVNYGVEVEVNCVVNALNISVIENLLLELDALGVKRLTLTPYLSVESLLDSVLMTTEAQILELRNTLCRHNKRSIVWELAIPEQDVTYSYYNGKHNICSGGRMSLVINHDGNVTICERLVDNPSFCVGNVNDEKIVDIWNGEKIEALTHPDPQQFQGTQCYACENFKKCITESGPCYARIQKVSSRIYDCDPFCVYALKKVRFH